MTSHTCSGRRQLLKGMLAGGALCTTCLSRAISANRPQIVDIANRTVPLDFPVKRVILGDGPLAYIVALLQPENPFANIIGWGDNFRAADLGGYSAYQARFPAIDHIPTFRGSNVGAIDIELAISLEPDVVILNLSSLPAAQSSGLMRHLADANIPVVFVDFRTKMFENTTRSITIMGELLGRADRAADFIQFRQTQIERIITPLKKIKHHPTVMIERAAGLYDDCCLSYGNGNFGQLVATAGGDNIGAHWLFSTFGTLHPEQVIASNPDIIIVTGANWSLYSPAGDWINLGPGANLEEGRARLSKLMERPAYRALSAVTNKQVHAIWHPFYDNPYHFIAMQQIAKWLHPDIFSDLDPAATFKELHQRFLPVTYQSGYWLSLNENV